MFEIIYTIQNSKSDSSLSPHLFQEVFIHVRNNLYNSKFIVRFISLTPPLRFQILVEAVEVDVGRAVEKLSLTGSDSQKPDEKLVVHSNGLRWASMDPLRWCTTLSSPDLVFFRVLRQRGYIDC